MTVSFLAPPVRACEVLAFYTRFNDPMGTLRSYYCKASDDEKRQAMQMVKTNPCILKKLTEQGKPVVREEISDVKPYWFSKRDAETAGPILESRLILEEKLDDHKDVIRRWGIRVTATGQRLLLSRPDRPARTVALRFDIGDPGIFEINCVGANCRENYSPLCN